MCRHQVCRSGNSIGNTRYGLSGGRTCGILNDNRGSRPAVPVKLGVSIDVVVATGKIDDITSNEALKCCLPASSGSEVVRSG